MGGQRHQIASALAELPLQQLPGIDEAFRAGTISYSKVRAMTRSATPENEQMLLQVALHGTAQHVEQLVRKYRRAESLADGGETRLDNLVLLCRHHHRLLHQDGYEIVKHGNQQFEFLTPHGDAMRAALVPQFAAADENMVSEILAIEREHEGIGLVIDSRTAVTRWQGERMDYDLAVWAMMRGPMLGLIDGIS